VFADDHGYFEHADMTKPEIKLGWDGLFSCYDMRDERHAITGIAWAQDWDAFEHKSKEMGAHFSVYDYMNEQGGIDLTKGVVVENKSPVANDHEAVVVVSKRWVQPGKMEEYKIAYNAAWQHFNETVPEMKSLFFSVDKEHEHVMHDVQWFSNMDAFMAHIDFSNEKRKELVMAFINLCDKDKPFEGTVYGGWDARVHDATRGMGAKFKFVTAHVGFIRQAPPGRKGPPTIVSSVRKVKPGKLAALSCAYRDLAQYYKNNDRGVVAFTAAPDPVNPLLVHDLQVFADDDGFVSHADADNIPEVNKGFEALFHNYDM